MMTESRDSSRQTTRRRFLKMTAGAGAAYITYRGAHAPTARAEGMDDPRVWLSDVERGAESPPNAIFVFSDTHRWQSLSFTEMSSLQTPNMQRLAQQGLSMNQTISNFPLCSPYRAMLMTGRWPYQQKMLDGKPGMITNGYLLSPEQPTLGKSFRQAGYRTAYVGKWHLGGLNAVPFGFNRSTIWRKTDDHWDSLYPDTEANEWVEYDGYNAIGMTNQAMEIIENNQDHPFLLVLSINPPHQAFDDAPPAWQALYPDEDSLPLRDNVDLTNAADSFWDDYRGFHAHISAVDHELGRLMDRLDELGLSDNTILIYTSDHGSMFQSQGEWGKIMPWEESIRVPFLIRWPGHIAPGSASDALFGTIDHMPTLLGLAGLPIPDACVGTDISRHMLGQDMETPDSQFIMGTPWPKKYFRGVRTGRYTLSLKHPNNDEGADLLYDNIEDPYQMVNRFDDPALSGVRSDLMSELEQYLRAVNDPNLLFSEKVHLPHLSEIG